MSPPTVALRDFDTLVKPESAPCVSIYLPTHRAGQEIRQDPIRLKNLLALALERLVATGMRQSEAEEFLAPARALLSQADVWQHQADGLALFLAPDTFREFRVALDVPELVVVADRFHLKPLIPLLSSARFYVLALSQNAVRLFEATPHTVQPVDLGTTPRSLEEALRLDEPEQQLQFHTGTAPAPGGRRRAMYHGQGGGKDDMKANLLRFCQLVDRGVRAALPHPRVPLVLAAVEYLWPIYRDGSSLTGVLPEGIAGNPDDLAPDELRQRAWRLVEPLTLADRAHAAERFHALAGSGSALASSNVAAVVAAAREGRVDVLFVAVGVQLWGRVGPDGVETAEGEPRPLDYDLLDDAAVQTLERRGRVYAVPPADVPGGGNLAAVLRY